MPCNFDVLSLYIRVIGDSNDRRKIFNHMKKNAFSNGMIPLQETHSCAFKGSIWTNQGGCGKNSTIFSHVASSTKGVLIAFRESPEYNKIPSSKCDNNDRYIVFNMQIPGSHFIIIKLLRP